MRPKLLLKLTPLIILFTLAACPLAYATSYTFGSVTKSDGWQGITNNEALAYAITVSSGTDDTFVIGTSNFYLLLNGTAKGCIWNGTGSYLTSSSNTATGTGTAAAWYAFTFADYELTNNTSYYFGFVYTEAGAGSKAYYDGSTVQTPYADSSNSYASPMSLSGGGPNGFLACYIQVEGDSPVASPTAAPDFSDMDTIIEGLLNFLVPLIVLLIPAFVLCMVARKWDIWLIMIGLAIGAGLGYAFGLVPLWLVFLIAVGIAGFAYSRVKN